MPTKQKKTNPEEPEWVTELEKWGDRTGNKPTRLFIQKELNPSKKYPGVARDLENKKNASDYRRFY